MLGQFGDILLKILSLNAKIHIFMRKCILVMIMYQLLKYFWYINGKSHFESYILRWAYYLAHCVLVTPCSIRMLVIIGSGNGLMPVERQSGYLNQCIVELLSVGHPYPLPETNFSEISKKKINFKILSAKWLPFVSASMHQSVSSSLSWLVKCGLNKRWGYALLMSIKIWLKEKINNKYEVDIDKWYM